MSTIRLPLSLSYSVDDETTPRKVTAIRGVELPSGILATPVDIRPEDRSLTDKAVQTVVGLFRWADYSRRDAGKE
jgi:hypothetical protein